MLDSNPFLFMRFSEKKNLVQHIVVLGAYTCDIKKGITANDYNATQNIKTHLNNSPTLNLTQSTNIETETRQQEAGKS